MMGRTGGKGIFWWEGIKLYSVHVPFKGSIIHPSGDNVRVSRTKERKVLEIWYHSSAVENKALE